MELIDKLVLALKSGASLEAACKSAGVDRKKLATMMEKEPELGCKIVSALADAEIGYLETIRQAAEKGDWRAAAWWLERCGHGFAKEKSSRTEESKKIEKVEIEIIKNGRRSARKKNTTRKKRENE